jgi:ATP synthase protein I
MDDSGQGTKKQNSTVGAVVKVESMIQLAIALPAACLIGWLLGAWLDKKFHTGWIGVAGIGVGAIAGFVQIFTTASRMLKRGDD